VATNIESLRMPPWLKKKLPDMRAVKELNVYLKSHSIQTVCNNSRCPNMGECFEAGNVSFLILGATCTRNCLFCAISCGRPERPNPAEAESIAGAVYSLRLPYVVVTSVTRDDLADGGSAHYADVVKSIKKYSSTTIVETLIPDFDGITKNIDAIIAAGANVVSHNMETVRRLYSAVRPSFDYSRSLKILRYLSSKEAVEVKSGFMVGLGETTEERIELIRDIRNTGCGILTIGQYLRPKGSPLDVKEYVKPDEFLFLKEEASKLGFRSVASGPFVRSSYRAFEYFEERK